MMDYSALLGLAADSPAVIDALNNLRTRSRPSLDPDDQDHDFYSWVPVRRKGIEFGFQDQAYLYAQDVSSRTGQTLILTDIIFYNWPSPDMAVFTGSLPFGLDFSDNRLTVARKLARLAPIHRYYKRDTFDFPDRRLIVSYRDADSAISDVVVRIPLHPWPAATLKPHDVPELAEIVKLFGASPRSKAFLSLFHAFDPEPHLSSLPRERAIDYSLAAGFELFFQKPSRLNISTHDDGLVLAAVRLYRQREKDGRQWPGRLPFNLTFGGSPTDLFEKVGHPPAKFVEDDIQGYAFWEFPQFDLLVLYSLYENLILRIQLMAKGYHASLRQTD